MIQPKKKVEGQLGEATKAKQIDSQTRFRNNFANLGKKTISQTRLILNYIHPTPFHHVYMAQSKCINPKKTFQCESLYLQ